MSTRAWLGDLVRAEHVFADQAAWEEGARQIGVAVAEARPPPPEPTPPQPDRELLLPEPPPRRRRRTRRPPPLEPQAPAKHAATLLWAVVSARSDDRGARGPGPQPPGAHAAEASDYARTAPPRAPAALDVARVVKAIEREAAPPRRTGLISVDGVVAAMGRGTVPDRLPRVWRARAPRKVFAWWDTSAALAPFSADAQALLHGLEERFGRRNVAVRRFEGGPFASMRDDDLEVVRSLREPRRGDAIVALTDLGLVRGDDVEGWRTVGERLGRRGVALVASPPFAPAPRDAPAWSMVPWAPAGLPSRAQRDADAHALLARLSITTWVERGLLRTLRLQAGLGAVAESDVWTHEAVDGSLPGALCLWRAPLAALRAALLALFRPELTRIVAEVQRWHAGPQPEELWVQDVITLIGLGLEVPGGEAARPERLAQRLLGEGDGALSRPVSAWIKSIEHAVPRGFASVRFRDLVARAHAGEASFRVPEFVEEMGGLRADGAVRWWHLAEHAGVCRIDAEAPADASPLAWIDGRTAMFEVEGLDGWRPPRAGTAVTIELPEVEVDAAAVARPEWAEAAGRDEYGVWASVRVGAVVFRMRWIEPGTGTIGSPPGEVGRGSGEDQRDVTFDEGFWMAETPVTQALWREVMGDAPGEFEGPERPVEKVSWRDTQRFLARLVERVPGLEAVLPTEEAWEYACRAGTQTATYGGDLGKGEAVESRALDAIAWYYANSRRETHPVATKAPNAWGLYDTLGHVWEWTSTVQGSDRVLRGGSWGRVARDVRAAGRFAAHPDDRYPAFGFRLSRGQVRPVQAGPEGRVRAGPEGRPVRSPPLAHTPVRARVSLRTDRTVLTLEALPRPAWATAFGRDRFGLWADDVIAGVRLRLRWIPPGRFLMGSPGEEPGHFRGEAPRHEVLLTRGYWLAEVPCTQDLWTAVMGPKKNPSHFRSPRRPVDSVTWDEARAFAEDALAERGHAGYALPTEAQWEHACRAGSTEATYGGAMDILGAHNAPVLDAIAWYGGNSGVGWDLPAAQGEDSGGWPDKQHPHTRAGTREVAQKAPNAWGLYDMLGNIFEWCADGLRRYTAEPVEDPDQRVEMGSDRVVRGSSWASAARDVRAADRSAAPPDVRRAYLGFRLSRGQVRPEQEPAQRSQRSAVAGRASGPNAGGTPRRAGDSHDVLTPALGLEHDSPNLASSAPTSRRGKPKKPKKS